MAAKSASAQTPPGSGSADAAAGAISVSALAALIERVLADNMPSALKVVGEIGQFKPGTHWYFSLKDAESVVQCVMWRQAASRAGFEPAAGQRIVVTGNVQFWGPGGRLSFIASRIEPVGIGALEIAFRKLCEELRGLGYFEPERKRPLPLMPRKVAVVTSATSAALQDVIDTVRRRCPGLPLALVDVGVQGEGASEEIATAIRALGRRHAELGVDVVLVTRGGGSMEDLWAFNERAVADAIFESPIPVVAAIGHETDTTIAELVADVRGATPTQAAMRIAPDRAALEQQLHALGLRLVSLARKQHKYERERVRGVLRHALFADPASLVVANAKHLEHTARRLALIARDALRQSAARLDRVGARLERARPAAVYAERRARLARASERLNACIAARLARPDLAGVRKRLDGARASAFKRASGRLDAAARSLDLVGPLNVLRRGYSVTLGPDGRALRSAADVHTGQSIRTRLAEGVVDSVVSGRSEPASPPSAPADPSSRCAPSSAAKPPKPPAPKRDQLDLF